MGRYNFNLWLQISKCLMESEFNNLSWTQDSGCPTSLRLIWCQRTSITSVSACCHQPKQELSQWSPKPKPLPKRCLLVCRLNKTKTWTRTSSSTQWKRNIWWRLCSRHVLLTSNQSLSRSDRSQCRCASTRSLTLSAKASIELRLISKCRGSSSQIRHASQKLTLRSGCFSKSSNHASCHHSSPTTTARCTTTLTHNLSWLNPSSSSLTTCNDSTHSRQLMAASCRSLLLWHHQIIIWFPTMKYNKNSHHLRDQRHLSRTRSVQRIQVWQNRELNLLR